MQLLDLLQIDVLRPVQLAGIDPLDRNLLTDFFRHGHQNKYPKLMATLCERSLSNMPPSGRATSFLPENCPL